MYIVADYEVSLNGSVNEITALMAEKLHDDSIVGKKSFHVEDDCFFCRLENVQALAMELAKAAGNATFTMKGFIDTSTSAGEYMDFEITYDGEKLISKNSDWYIELGATCYDDYEGFCEEYCDDDEEPLYTEEQYEAFCDGVWFEVEARSGNVIVKEVPLTEIEELTVD